MTDKFIEHIVTMYSPVLIGLGQQRKEMEMSKFNVGDRVRRVRNGWEHEMPLGFEGIITKTNDNNIWFVNKLSGYLESHFELADPISDAVKLLQDNGYSVVKPKPKIEGWVNIYQYSTDSILPGNVCDNKELADQRAKESSMKRLACIKFTEGDGL